ncbi:hypothetical protein BO71DRAFT_436882 [Aspergillus ellipticus CBS 707.79]|uniref:Uncharacterized protein n=1 Tax=Aspergillus ellipticus CBS 707.79 TaxID=1448320 RepID=A0A319DRE3_9EURO|nr:hypothetical protein BO71DRAFT_436882 [Aspergillus ellipticus CBS 707.79]
MHGHDSSSKGILKVEEYNHKVTGEDPPSSKTSSSSKPSPERCERAINENCPYGNWHLATVYVTNSRSISGELGGDFGLTVRPGDVRSDWIWECMSGFFHHSDPQVTCRTVPSRWDPLDLFLHRRQAANQPALRIGQASDSLGCKVGLVGWRGSGYLPPNPGSAPGWLLLLKISGVFVVQNLDPGTGKPLPVVAFGPCHGHIQGGTANHPLPWDPNSDIYGLPHRIIELCSVLSEVVRSLALPVGSQQTKWDR